MLPAIGEEWGFAGVATVLLLLGFLVSSRAADRAARAERIRDVSGGGPWALIAFEMLLISGGVLGAIPLSGVVSPFLSFGQYRDAGEFPDLRDSDGNFESIARRESVVIDEPFRRPVRCARTGRWASAQLTLLGFAGYYQVAHDREFLARETKVFEDDGVKRPQHNPRLNSLAREIRRGDIFDRNGILLATSDWNELERRRAEYREARYLDRHGLLAAGQPALSFRLAHRASVLGDLRTGENFHATNASLIEHDSNVKLQGFTDYRELAPLIRYRHQPGNPEIAQLLARDRNVTASHRYSPADARG